MFAGRQCIRLAGLLVIHRHSPNHIGHNYMDTTIQSIPIPAIHMCQRTPRHSQGTLWALSSHREGHNYIGHNHVDHNYIGHNYIGHNYTGNIVRGPQLAQGGAVYAAEGVTLTTTNSSMRDNVARGQHAEGGALWVGELASLAGCGFVENRAVNAVGAGHAPVLSLFFGYISASPTACPSGGCGRAKAVILILSTAGTQNDRLGVGVPVLKMTASERQSF